MREIPLANGRGVALVDDEDYDRLMQHSWYLQSGRYAAATFGNRGHLMHRVILGNPDMPHIDHIDGNGLNNQKSNLRACTASQNQHNRRPKNNRRSRYKGVTVRGQRAFCAEIRLDGRSTHLGYFRTEEEAARAYDETARERFGEFARLNFPREGEQAA